VWHFKKAMAIFSQTGLENITTFCPPFSFLREENVPHIADI